MSTPATPTRTYARPRIVVSRCLGFESCRWNGQRISSPVVEALAPHVEFVTICPEFEIGMGVPRLPIRIVRMEDDDHLVQNESDEDFSEPMRRYASDTLKRLDRVDGFLLKSRSPSCGLTDVKLYPGPGKTTPLGEKTAGFFAREVLLRRPLTPIDDEIRLCDPVRRERFLTGVFTLADFHRCCEPGAMGDLIDFHSRCKYLFMACDPSTLSEAGSVLGNHGRAPVEEVVAGYRPHLLKLLALPFDRGRQVNAMQHMLGYFRGVAPAAEYESLSKAIDRFSEGEATLWETRAALGDAARRHGVAYIEQQSWLAPYPPALANAALCDDATR